MISREEFIKANLKPKSPTISDLAKPGGGFDITGEEVRELKKKYSKELEEIQYIRNIFSRKKDLKDKDGKKLFKFEFAEFYDWYISQKRVCEYCGIEEWVLRDLFNTGKLSSKRGSRRGRTLEIERKNSEINVYSPENCILACYFCNNHKSDIISEEDHRKYFAEKIAQYLRDKHNESK